MTRNNSFKAQLEAKRRAASTGSAPPSSTPSSSPPAPTAENPTPDPAAVGFRDPEIRAQALSDELRDAQAEIAREREARQQAERRLAALEADKVNASSRTALSALVSKRRRPPWR